MATVSREDRQLALDFTFRMVFPDRWALCGGKPSREAYEIRWLEGSTDPGDANMVGVPTCELAVLLSKVREEGAHAAIRELAVERIAQIGGESDVSREALDYWTKLGFPAGTKLSGWGGHAVSIDPRNVFMICKSVDDLPTNLREGAVLAVGTADNHVFYRWTKGVWAPSIDDLFGEVEDA